MMKKILRVPVIEWVQIRPKINLLGEFSNRAGPLESGSSVQSIPNVYSKCTQAAPLRHFSKPD